MLYLLSVRTTIGLVDSDKKTTHISFIFTILIETQKTVYMTYYKTIDGVKYDKELLELADKLTAGAGDGRLSQEDAWRLFGEVKDGNVYTDVEKDTIAYLRDNYNWTDAADEWFRTEIRKWAATK